MVATDPREHNPAAPGPPWQRRERRAWQNGPMHSYLVGGAVRDHLLGRPVVDRDHVVVGARPEDLLARGLAVRGEGAPLEAVYARV